MFFALKSYYAPHVYQVFMLILSACLPSLNNYLSLKHSSLHYYIDFFFFSQCALFCLTPTGFSCVVGAEKEEVVLFYKDCPMNKENFKELMALRTGIGQRKAIYLEGCL